MTNPLPYNFTFKAIDANSLMLSGYASVFSNVDMHNDIIMPGAFQDSIAKHLSNKSSIKVLWQHNPNAPIGVIKQIYEDAYGVFVQAEIICETIKGREAIALIKQKALDSFSIGFNVKRFDFNSAGQRQILIADLWEISVVTFPANIDAKITNCKTSFIDKDILKKAKSTFIY